MLTTHVEPLESTGPLPEIQGGPEKVQGVIALSSFLFVLLQSVCTFFYGARRSAPDHRSRIAHQHRSGGSRLGSLPHQLDSHSNDGLRACRILAEPGNPKKDQTPAQSPRRAMAPKAALTTQTPHGTNPAYSLVGHVGSDWRGRTNAPPYLSQVIERLQASTLKAALIPSAKPPNRTHPDHASDPSAHPHSDRSYGPQDSIRTSHSWQSPESPSYAPDRIP